MRPTETMWVRRCGLLCPVLPVVLVAFSLALAAGCGVSGNAIETLRQAVGEHGFQATNPMLSTLATEALAAMEALLEAAKALANSHGNPNDPTLPSGTYTLGGGYLSQEHLDALAAAVRRVTGEDVEVKP